MKQNHDSLYENEAVGFNIDLNEDFSLLWEDAQKEKTSPSGSLDQEEVLKLTDDSWISFNDDNAESMIDCFDIEEMTSMLDTKESNESNTNQEISFLDARGLAVESCCPGSAEGNEMKTNESAGKNPRKKISSRRKRDRSKTTARKRHAPDKAVASSSKTTKVSHSRPDAVPTQITGVQDAYQQTNQFDNRYQTLMRNLAVSMRRTEMTRAQVVKIQRDFQRAPRKNNQRSHNSSLSAFFSGSRSTITSGLEQSRRQLQGYLSQVKNCNIMF